MLSHAASLLQLLTWLFSIPIFLLNLILIFSIRRERKTDNRFRWFNSMFLYSTYSNTLLLLFYLMLQPVVLPARSLIYLVFLGPVAWILPRLLLRLMYSFIIGVMSFQVFLAPISLLLRWLVVTKRISCMQLNRKLVGILYLTSSAPFTLLSLIFFNVPGNFSPGNQEELDDGAVLQLAGGNYSYLPLKLAPFSTYLLLVFMPFLLAFPLTFIFHKLFMKSIRNLSNDLIDLGYHDSAAVSFGFLWFSGFNIFLITIPHLFLTLTILLKWQLGVRAITVTWGLMWVPLTGALTIFGKFRAYRRQTGFLAMEYLQNKNLQVPIAVIQNTTVQVEIPVGETSL